MLQSCATAVAVGFSICLPAWLKLPVVVVRPFNFQTLWQNNGRRHLLPRDRRMVSVSRTQAALVLHCVAVDVFAQCYSFSIYSLVARSGLCHKYSMRRNLSPWLTYVNCCAGGPTTCKCASLPVHFVSASCRRCINHRCGCVAD